MIYKAEIIENIEISPNIHRISISKPLIKKEIKPGTFFNIKCNESDFPLLRRPISIGLVEEKTLSFFIQRKGKGTEILCKKEKGSYLNIMGPLGNGFNIKEEREEVLIVGGGIGVAPLLELTRSLSEENRDSLKVVLGFKSDPYIIEDYKKYIDEVITVSEEKDEYHYKGYVTKAVSEETEKKKYDVIYACGPKAMLKSIKEFGEEKGIEVELLMEERMACGMGACLVCTCKVKSNEDEWKYVRTCKEGPVFNSKEVIFDE